MNFNPAQASLDEIQVQAWELLRDGVERRTAPFHTPVLATASHDGADARTVVLRGADAPSRTVICHTDQRSPKIAQLSDGQIATWGCGRFPAPRRE